MKWPYDRMAWKYFDTRETRLSRSVASTKLKIWRSTWTGHMWFSEKKKKKNEKERKIIATTQSGTRT